jgi:hypothetical protein
MVQGDANAGPARELSVGLFQGILSLAAPRKSRVFAEITRRWVMDKSFFTQSLDGSIGAYRPLMAALGAL